MPRTALALLPISVALALSFDHGLAAAAPAGDDGAPEGPSSNAFDPADGVGTANSRRSSALDAAFGTPPSGAENSPNTTDDPNYSGRKGAGTPDQTYGSTARSVGAGGEAVGGLDIYDIPMDDEGYAEDVPDVHVVQRGDTLWDISRYYLQDAHAWPRLWSYNEHVTNAHWIFPGDRIRLYDPRFGPRGEQLPDFRYAKSQVPDGAAFETLMLNQFAFVDAAEFDTSMRIIGGGEAAVMMSTFDTVYMKYDRGSPPVPGERLVVYAPQKKVLDIEDKKVLGYIVQIMGEVEVQTIARKAAEGTVAAAHNPIERGYRVGPLRRQFRRIDAVPPEKSAVGLVVATLNDTSPFPLERARARKSLLGEHVMVGETQFMVINIGRTNGLEVGNLLEIVRKGDEFTKKRVLAIPYEDGWPRRVIGTAVVLQTQEKTALVATTYSRREIERGDHVELRGPELVRSENTEAAALRERKAGGEAGARGEVGGGGASIGGGARGGARGGGSGGSDSDGPSPETRPRGASPLADDLD